MSELIIHDFPHISPNKKSIHMRKLVCGHGINDANYQIRIVAKGKILRCPFYWRWNSMIYRCYSAKEHIKNPTYKGCTVSSEWLIFSNFRKWMIRQNWKNKQLDKDLIVPGNKVYSANTCLFVNQEINSLLTSCNSLRGKYPKGVSLFKPDKNYRAQISLYGKMKHIGYFDTPESAEKAYRLVKSNHVIKIALLEQEPLKSALMRHAELCLST